MSLLTLEDVEQLVKELDAGFHPTWRKTAANMLREKLKRGDFAAPSERILVEKWLERESAQDALKFANSPEGLARRNTEATERAANAAVRSAKSAAIAIFISIAALAVAAWPHINTLAVAAWPHINKF
ncbi:hypothetical protein [Janthinobacterium sp. HH104]|uniref:hypothetical protein n=1 Tax=Janthinobacterium sp. HH104 TaxID=1537276 RepID=UPI00087371BC|nr:hypothetical protein [Janthinobacterium sp. HH104]